MMKKVLSILVTLSMLAGFCTVASAEEISVGTPSGWSRVPKTSQFNGTYIVTNEEKAGGDMSLKFTCTNATSGYEYYQNSPSVTVTNGAVYNFSMKVKGAPAKNWRFIVGLVTGTGSADFITIGTLNTLTASEADANGWKTYTGTYTAAVDGTYPFAIKTDHPDNAETVYYDDISLKDTSGNELLSNGGFETFTEFVLTPQNLAATSEDAKTTVTWTNPAYDASAVAVTVNGEAQDVSGCVLTAGASNSVTITGLENGSDHEIVVSYTTVYGTKSSSVKVTPKKLIYGLPESWGVNNSANWTYNATNELSKDGDYSFKTVYTTNNGDRYIFQKIASLKASTAYDVVLYMKNDTGTLSRDWRYGIMLGGNVIYMNDASLTKTTEDGWTKFTGTITTPATLANTELRILSRGDSPYNAYVAWDGISVKESGTDSELVVNGDFEKLQTFGPVGLGAAKGEDSATVTWTNPNVAATEIKMTVNGENYDGTFALDANAENTVELTNLTPGTEYEIVVSVTSASGTFSDSVKVKPVKTVFASSVTGWMGILQSDFSYTVTTADSIDGDSALYTVYKTSADAGAYFYQAVLEQNKEYDVTLYVKYANPDTPMKYRYAVNLSGNEYNFNDQNWVVENAGNGWIKYSGTFVSGTNTDCRVRLTSRGKDTTNDYVMFDGVSVKAAGTDEELLTNGSFETYNADGLEPKNLVAESGDASAVITWNNPTLASSAITVTVNGETVDTASCSLARSAENTLELANLENGTTYAVVVTLATAFGDFSAETTVTPKKLITGAPANWKPSTISGWSYYITNEVSKTDEFSLRASWQSQSGDRYIYQTIDSLEASTDYDVEFYVKSDTGVLNPEFRYAIVVAGQMTAFDTFEKETDSDGWIKYSGTITTPETLANKEFRITLRHQLTNEYVYIDGVSFKKSGTDTELLANESFEEKEAPKEAATDAFFYADAWLYWTISAQSELSGFNVYKVDGGEKILVGTADAETNYCAIEDGWADNAEYVITSVYANGDETEGISVKHNSIVINDVQFDMVTIDGDSVTVDKSDITAVETGTVMATVEIANNKSSDETVSVYVAVYSLDGRLIGVEKAITASAGANNITSFKASVSATSGNILKAFAWDSDMNAIGNAAQI